MTSLDADENPDAIYLFLYIKADAQYQISEHHFNCQPQTKTGGQDRFSASSVDFIAFSFSVEKCACLIMLMKFMTSCILVVFAFVTLASTQGISIRRNRLTLYNSRLTCSPGMACRMAVCVWQRIPRITDDRCNFLDSHCSCPEQQICAMTGNYATRNKLITFQYSCRDPEVLFRDSSENNNNNNI